MFTKKPAKQSLLEKTIDALLCAMAEVNGDSEEYSIMADNLVKLYKLREEDSKRRVSPDTIALIIGNLVGIAMIVGHERANVVTSKAVAFLGKLLK